MRIDGLFVEITGPTTVVPFGLRDGLRVNVSWTHFYETFDLGSSPWSVKPFRRRPQGRFKYLSATYDAGATEVVGKLTVEINDYQFAHLRAYAGSREMPFERAVAELVDEVWAEARDGRKLPDGSAWSCRLPARPKPKDIGDCPF